MVLRDGAHWWAAACSIEGLFPAEERPQQPETIIDDHRTGTHQPQGPTTGPYLVTKPRWVLCLSQVRGALGTGPGRHGRRLPARQTELKRLSSPAEIFSR